ncbi:HEPN domain-containing protein [Flavobacterium pectinovorum]|uniref:HEPN domain-containing protein n=1 Tax=Flavobacterium pectinovorum TaxID=29533 RepID=A0AB36NYW5_9FLAO|nr:hypothetical protein [Flavobacterium pectinovorum]OXB03712.1 hypothetical protein B0A72_14500 [Flavobacterium pectinovorum]SHL64173.1 hypothetical protein SAMN05444387_1130 [Flavobacterium pectinovorum]
MSEYIKKSLNNFESAELLFENGKYSSSIHCVYYSTYQLILYILKYKLNSEWNSFQEKKYAESLNNKKNPKEDSHNLTISFIKENITTTNEVFGRLFDSKIGILKHQRHTADYKENAIDMKTATNSLDLSKRINDELIKHFAL